MRLNRYLAQATGLSRRAADTAIAAGRVQVNGQPAAMGQEVETETVTLDGKVVTPQTNTQTIILNKPAGYVCSRDGQGSKTIYDLLPAKYHHLKPVGRLDKDSSGLLLLTNDGNLAHQLTHPSFQKTKVYEVALNKSLKPDDAAAINKGVQLEDGLSKLELEAIQNSHMRVRMQEGRNRQIRRTFAALGYNVIKLHRTHFGEYKLEGLPISQWKSVV